jgi:glycosyltransferase involved in cell wall biosynthesis
VKYFYFEEMPDFRKGERWTSVGGTKINWKSFFNLLITVMRSDAVFFLGAIRPLPWQILLLFLSCLMRKRVFVASESLKTRSFPKWITALFSALSPNFTLLAMGKGCKGDFNRLGFNGRCLKFSFYENYPELDTAIKDGKYSAQIVRILLVGRLIKRKNFELVLRSLRDYHGKKSIRIDIAGDGELLGQLSSIADDVMKNESITVHFHGHIEAEALNDLFKSATLFVCPSLYEGWGVVLNHALHYGLPILALNSVRSAEGYLVDDRVNGKISTLDSFKDDLLKMFDSDLSAMSHNSFKLNEQWRLGIAQQRFVKIVQCNKQFTTGVFSEAI